MEKSIKNQMLTIGLLLVLIFSSCSKKGDTGPAGKDGKDGTNGINGTNGNDGNNGKNGTNGKDGNANVLSYTISVTSGDWSYQSSNGGYYYVGITSSAINQAIVDKGAVICYLKINSTSWIALPWDSYSYFILNGGMGVLYDYNANPGGQTFRFVVIASSQLARNPKIDLTDYNQVAKTYNISE